MSKTDVKERLSEEEIRRREAESGKRESGEPDANLSAVGGGGITGAAAGAVVGGAVGGPAGAAVGAVAGAVAGAAAADKIQDKLDPKIEEVYWQQHYYTRPYYKSGDPYENYLPAYRFGWESAIRKDYAGKNFDEIEPQLRSEWTKSGAASDWITIRDIVRDGFDRVRSR